MELDETSTPIDPEVRAYVSSLVTALGGTGTDEDGRYVLGDDALACLKDLKKWLKLYDEKINRLDVARCLAEANLVEGDLLEILALWPEEATEDKLKSKIALACLELLVPLTWPIEKDETQMTVNHHRHIPYIQIAQASYKRAVLENQSKFTLRAAVRIGLPPMAIPIAERTSRDEGIIRLLLYFFRNIALISTPQNIPTESKEDAISRSATIEAFHYQDVLALILTISSNIGEDFNTQDVVILEILFHILKGVDVEKLFMDKDKLDKSNADELGSLLAKEKNMHRSYAKTASTRHNRFGTMIWVKRDNARMSTVSGQENLTSTQLTLSKMDRSKRWNKPRRRKDVVYSNDRFDLPTPITYQASQHLRSFVEEFLDSSFNPLFNHIRRAIEREADRVLEAHKQQFFYLISWFLQAERARRQREGATEMRNRNKKVVETFEANNFALVASVLNQETFVALHRFMQDRLDLKSWRELTAGMRCFTQILLIVQDMANSPLEEDQEIAENIQNRIFYEETTHDRVIAVLRGYKDQGFDYLDACTELSHVFLRMLEKYSKENIDLQVRSRRRARKQKKEAALERGDADAYGDDASEKEDLAEIQRESKERKFDFTRLSTKFMTQSCINTFVSFTKYHNDLDAEQLKRAHRFFHRVAFKQDLSVMLFRVDIVAMFYKIIQGPEALDRASPAFREWEDLVRHLIRKLTRKLQDRPELAIEMLFSKIPSSVFYLEFGYEKQTVSSKPRPPATLEVKGAMSRDEQIGVAVAVLHEEQLDAINWVTNILSSAMSERQSWEGEAAARRIDQAQEENSSQSGTEAKAPSIDVLPDNEERRVAIFRDAKLRLLMSLVGFERLGIEDVPDAQWIIPSTLSASQLREAHSIIQRHRDNPTKAYGDDDPMAAEEMIRRKPLPKTSRAEFDDESDNEGLASSGDEDFQFPVGGLRDTNSRTAALEDLKKKRRKRRSSHSDDEDGISDGTREARRKARRQTELEKISKIKSAEFVYDSDEDDEADQDFFAREEQRRKGHAAKIMEVLRSGMVGSRKNGKRKPEDENNSEKRKIRLLKPSVTTEGYDEKSSEPELGSLSPVPQDNSDGSETLDDSSRSSTPVVELNRNPILRDIPGNVQALNRSTPAMKDYSIHSDSSGEKEDEEVPVKALPRRRYRPALMFDSDTE